MTDTVAPRVSSRSTNAALVAWLITALYFFYQYALRSAPAVMMPQLSAAFGLTTTGIASMLGLFYYGYSPFSLVAGAAIDGFGPRKVIPIGAAAVGLGAIMFATGNQTIAGLGRFLQGAGGAVAFVGAVYIITAGFPRSRVATFTGATQMFGMAGGSAGQMLVAPLISAGIGWSAFWVVMGVAGIAMGVLLWLLIPRPPSQLGRRDWLVIAGRSLVTVFRNPQSILCGVIAGLVFIPTTIFDMVWGVRYLQEAHGFEYGEAVMRSSMVPLGWIIGCPLLGMISDRIGRRKPVILGGALVLLLCLAWILYGSVAILPPYVLGLLAGIASGAGVLPTTVAKEANPPEVGGTATGVVNFLNFTFSALLGPVFGWILLTVSADAEGRTLEHYQAAFQPMLYGLGVAIVLTLLLKETGPAAAGRTAVGSAPLERQPRPVI
jgi:MFS family permease